MCTHQEVLFLQNWCRVLRPNYVKCLAKCRAHKRCFYRSFSPALPSAVISKKLISLPSASLRLCDATSMTCIRVSAVSSDLVPEGDLIWAKVPCAEQIYFNIIDLFETQLRQFPCGHTPQPCKDSHTSDGLHPNISRATFLRRQWVRPLRQMHNSCS